MTDLVKALVFASYMRSILDSWSVNERSNALHELRRVVKKFMDSRKRTNAKDYALSIAIGNIAWANSINHFKVERIMIEGTITVIRLHSLCEDPLTKYGNINEKRINAFTLAHYNGDNEVDIERNADKVVKHLSEQTDLAYAEIKGTTSE
jgi:hypothetical protein